MPTPDNSRPLVERATGGDAAAIDALLERHLPALRAFIRLRSSDQIRARESVSDLVQSVCREALQDVGSYQYRGEAAFKQWLFTMALRKVIDRGRYLERRQQASAVEVPLASEASAMPSENSRLLECYASFCTPSQDAMIREETERIERALLQLPDEYREIIIEARIVGLSYAEIAEQTGRSDEAVRKLLARALARLARLLN